MLMGVGPSWEKGGHRTYGSVTTILSLSPVPKYYRWLGAFYGDHIIQRDRSVSSHRLYRNGDPSNYNVVQDT